MPAEILDVTGGHATDGRRSPIIRVQDVRVTRTDATGDKLQRRLTGILRDRGLSLTASTALAEVLLLDAADTGRDQYLLTPDGYTVVIVAAPHADTQADIDDGDLQADPYSRSYPACTYCGGPGPHDGPCPVALRDRQIVTVQAIASDGNAYGHTGYLSRRDLSDLWDAATADDAQIYIDCTESCDEQA